MVRIKLNGNLILYAVIAVLAFLLWMKGCDDDPVPKKVIVPIPEVSNELPEKNPDHNPIVPDTVYKIKWKEVEVEIPNPVNEKLSEKYQQTKDSLDRFKMYLDAIQIRKFQTEYEDEYLRLSITGKVQGEVKSITPTYTIKERNVETTIASKQTVLRVLGGVEVGNNTQLNDMWLKVNLGIQNLKGNVWKVGWAKNNNLDYIFVGYDFSILNIKK